MEANLKNIRGVIDSRGTSVTWLSEQLGITPRTFYNKCKTRFSKSEKFHMSDLLGVEFE